MIMTTKTTNDANNVIWITEYQLFEASIHQADLCKQKHQNMQIVKDS